jgi:hypothetical protein
VLFRQERVGRTASVSHPQVSERCTVGSLAVEQPQITVGAIRASRAPGRRCDEQKLDELPQLIDVVAAT